MLMEFKNCGNCIHSSCVNSWDFEDSNEDELIEVEKWYCDKNKHSIDYDYCCNDFEESYIHELWDEED